MMTNAQLRQVMRYYLEHVNRMATPITDEAVHRDLLSRADGYEPASSARLYEGFVRYSLAAVENPVRDWPDDWLDLSVGELADVLVPPLVTVGGRSVPRRRSIQGRMPMLSLERE